jgi:hypothetical protein
MHHASASFSTRLRIKRAQVDAGMQTIWMTRKPHDPTAEAFAALEQWLAAQRAAPHQSLTANRPAAAADRCFDAQGALLFAGDGVWDGDWNQHATGACMNHYSIYSNSRVVAGADLAGDVFQCARISVDAAYGRGVYGDVDMSTHLDRLRTIFPQGVCDYTQPDQSRPNMADLTPGSSNPSEFAPPN